MSRRDRQIHVLVATTNMQESLLVTLVRRTGPTIITHEEMLGSVGKQLKLRHLAGEDDEDKGLELSVVDAEVNGEERQPA